MSEEVKTDVIEPLVVEPSASVDEVFGALDKEIDPPAAVKEEVTSDEPVGDEPVEGEERQVAGDEDDFGIPVESVAEDKPAPEPVVAPETEALRAELQKAQASNDRLMTLLETQGKPKEGQPTQQDAMREVESIAKKYNFNVQPQTVEQIQSDDPQTVQRALNGLVLGTAIAVHKTVSMEFDQKLKDMQNGMSNAAQQANTATTQKQAVEGFYGRFPQLNTPAIRPIVGTVAKGFAERGVGWNDETALQIAQQTRSVLQESGLQLRKQNGGGGTQPFAGAGKSVSNTPEGLAKKADPNSRESIADFASN